MQEKSCSKYGKFVLKSFLAMACTVSLISPVLAQQIITDGKTATTLSVNGNVTNVTTSTISGDVALNSFSKFNVDSGKTVNLVVPESTNNLLNLINGPASSINGVLNGVKNGEIRGNVYFLNPNGILIGRTGQINVEGLTAITPTRDFVRNFFNSPGNPDPAKITAVLTRNVPINPSACITNKGEINTRRTSAFEGIGDWVDIESGTFSNYGRINTSSVGPRVAFALVANIVNLDKNSAINASDTNLFISKLTSGDIEIVSSKKYSSSVLSFTPKELATINGDSILLGPWVKGFGKNLRVKTDMGSIGVGLYADNVEILANQNLNPFGLRAQANDRIFIKPGTKINAESVSLTSSKDICIGHDVNIKAGGIFTYSESGPTTIGYRSNLVSTEDQISVTSGGNLYIGENSKILSKRGLFLANVETFEEPPVSSIIIGRNSKLSSNGALFVDAGINAIINENVSIKAARGLSSEDPGNIYITAEARSALIKPHVSIKAANDFYATAGQRVDIYPKVRIDAGNNLSLYAYDNVNIRPYASLRAGNNIEITSQNPTISPNANLDAGGQIIINN